MTLAPERSRQDARSSVTRRRSATGDSRASRLACHAGELTGRFVQHGVQQLTQSVGAAVVWSGILRICTHTAQSAAGRGPSTVNRAEMKSPAVSMFTSESLATTRQQRCPLAQGDWCIADDDLVEQASVDELAGEVTSSDDPEHGIRIRTVVRRIRLDHRLALLDDLDNVPAGETEVGAVDGLLLPVAEHPGGLGVGPGSVRRLVTDELVGGTAHHQRGGPSWKGVHPQVRVLRFGMLLGEQPREAVVGVCKEAVEAAGGVVDDSHGHQSARRGPGTTSDRSCAVGRRCRRTGTPQRRNPATQAG